MAHPSTPSHRCHGRLFLTCEPGCSDNSADGAAGTIRANHCIPLGDPWPYYFEVKAVETGPECYVGIGCCEEQMSLDEFLGWPQGSWGYHAEEGQLMAAGELNPVRGPRYQSGDIIGCGVDLREGTAFFTKNGERLGEPFVPSALGSTNRFDLWQTFCSTASAASSTRPCRLRASLAHPG